MASIDMLLPDGYSARPARPGDEAAIAAILNRYSRETTGIDIVTPVDIEKDHSAPRFDPEEDSRVVLAPDGTIAAYASFWSNVEPAVHPYFVGRVDVPHRRKGIGRALVRYGIQRARDTIDRAPDGARVTVRASNHSKFVPARRLLESEGFRAYRYHHDMRIELAGPIPAPALPEGIELRRYRHPDEMEPLARATQEAFADHYGSLPETFGAYFARFRFWLIEDEVFDPTLMWVATAGDEIVGMNLSRKYDGADRDTGYVMTLGVRRPWRRRGIALALLNESFEEFRQRGRKAVTLGVDADSLTGAVALYEKAGMRVHHRFDNYELEIRPGKELARQEMEGAG